VRTEKKENNRILTINERGCPKDQAGGMKRNLVTVLNFRTAKIKQKNLSFYARKQS
jgi:hypothetical protein